MTFRAWARSRGIQSSTGSRAQTDGVSLPEAVVRLQSRFALPLLALALASPLATFRSPWVSASLASAQDCTVYVTRTGHRYHQLGCSSLRLGGAPVRRSAAVARGLLACRNCGGSSCESTSRTSPSQPLMRSSGRGVPQSQDCIVQVTRTGARYHKPSCPSLRMGGMPVRRSEARSKGLTPCKRCGGSTCEN